VLPLTLLGEGGKRGSQPFALAMCIESLRVPQVRVSETLRF
jgi:hypothetical protein